VEGEVKELKDVNDAMLGTIRDQRTAIDKLEVKK